MIRKLLAMAGFVVLGLSPSFIDWDQEPEKRGSMIGFYAVGLSLIWIGLWDGQ
jgi:hypothetical protein